MQDVDEESRLGALDQGLEIAVDLLGGLRAEDLPQHLREDCELVRVVGETEVAGN